MRGTAQWTAWRLGLQVLKTHSIDLALFAPPTFSLFLWSYWFDAHAPNIFVEHAVFAASGEVAAVVARIFMCAPRMREAKALTTYGLPRSLTTAESRTVEHALPFWHVDTRVRGCMQRPPVRRRPLTFSPKVHRVFSR
jgi:hypothetical protein